MIVEVEDAVMYTRFPFKNGTLEREIAEFHARISLFVIRFDTAQTKVGAERQMLSEVIAHSERAHKPALTG